MEILNNDCNNQTFLCKNYQQYSSNVKIETLFTLTNFQKFNIAVKNTYQNNTDHIKERVYYCEVSKND